MNVELKNKFEIGQEVWFMDSVTVGETCGYCAGTGRLEGRNKRSIFCPNCSGTGKVGKAVSKVRNGYVYGLEVLIEYPCNPTVRVYYVARDREELEQGKHGTSFILREKELFSTRKQAEAAFECGGP